MCIRDSFLLFCAPAKEYEHFKCCQSTNRVKLPPVHHPMYENCWICLWRLSKIAENCGNFGRKLILFERVWAHKIWWRKIWKWKCWKLCSGGNLGWKFEFDQFRFSKPTGKALNGRFLWKVLQRAHFPEKSILAILALQNTPLINWVKPVSYTHLRAHETLR